MADDAELLEMLKREVDAGIAAKMAEVDAMVAAAPEPCYDCECCALWTESLEALRASITSHVAGEMRLRPCSPECLVCGSVEWQQRR